ncbi:MAG: hypothetical protein CMJ34_01895 [Phycisphaerae bacterium]|nr:hypothetical protein [Phycisphaerae bacterium]
MSKEGEVLADLPGRGLLLDLGPGLQRHFGARLALGRANRSPAGVEVEWELDHSSINEDEVRAAIDDLEDGLQRSRDLVNRLSGALGRVSNPDVMISVDRELVELLGGSPDSQQVPRMRASEIRLQRDTLQRACEGVQKALADGLVGELGGRGMLFGWCFLSAESVGLEGAEIPGVEITNEGIESHEGEDHVRLVWNVSGSGDSIVLQSSRDGSFEEVDGTKKRLYGYQSNDIWLLPLSMLAGREVRASAWINGESYESEVIRFDAPEDESIAIAPSEPPLSEEVLPGDPGPIRNPVQAEESNPPEEDPARRDWSWLLRVLRWLLVMLLLLALALVLLGLLRSCTGCMGSVVTTGSPSPGVDSADPSGDRDASVESPDAESESDASTDSSESDPSSDSTTSATDDGKESGGEIEPSGFEGDIPIVRLRPDGTEDSASPGSQGDGQ